MEEVVEETNFGTVRIVSTSTTPVLSFENHQILTEDIKQLPLPGQPLRHSVDLGESPSFTLELPEKALSIKVESSLQLDDETSCANSSIHTIMKTCSLISHPASRSETPLTHHDEECSASSSAGNSIMALHHTKVEREFYDDDISSDTEDSVTERSSQPPPSPSKFSPKRMLHRAKSSLNEDSVRNIGRRTSLFLEKFNQLHHQQVSPHQTPPPSPSPGLPPLISKNNNIKEGLKRQSSKFSVKGKTFGKKLKRVLSFNQTSSAVIIA